MSNKNLKWGIKTEEGYVNFIHGTPKNIYEFETSQDINDICIFSEVAAHAYAQSIKGIAFPIVLSEQPKLSIPKKIAEELEELTGKTNWESTPYSVIEEKGKINTWAYLGHGKCSEQLYKFCRDNTRIMNAYLNPLTRPFVEVTDE